MLSDTARYNEASGLPKHDIIETPQPDGSVLFGGRVKIGWVRLEWREEPVNWVKNQWFEHIRHFSRGPLRMLRAHLRMEPEGEGCRCVYTLDVEPANIMGILMLRMGFFKWAEKSFDAVVERIESFLSGQDDAPFDIVPLVLSEDQQQKISRAVAMIEESQHGHGLARPLADYATKGLEADVLKIRPLELARRWNVLSREAIEISQSIADDPAVTPCSARRR